MPINNNVQAMNAYDRADAITVEFLGGVSHPNLQHTVHCLAFEILRSWTREGLAKYNDEVGYEALAQSILDEAVNRMALNPATAAWAAQLTDSDKAIARQQGENYFEHGYVAILAGVDPNAKKTLRRDTGVS